MKTETQTKIKHNPLPWSWWPDCCREGGMITTNKNGAHIAAPTERGEQTKANAEFICRAVNSHYELVEALEQAALMLECEGGYGDTLDRALAAIRKAKGKTK